MYVLCINVCVYSCMYVCIYVYTCVCVCVCGWVGGWVGVYEGPACQQSTSEVQVALVVDLDLLHLHPLATLCIRQHASAYVSIRQYASDQDLLHLHLLATLCRGGLDSSIEV